VQVATVCYRGVADIDLDRLIGQDEVLDTYHEYSSVSAAAKTTQDGNFRAAGFCSIGKAS
jgi:hypothetical protein